MTTKLNWGIIGTGNISNTFAQGILNSNTGQLVAIASRTKESADAFGDQFAVAQRYDSYQKLLEDSDVQAVYIGTPHPTHATLAIQCAEAGKHILCEKPIALNHADTMAVVEAALENGVFLMEAFMYRCHPQTQKLVELIQNGEIGDVKLIKATFGFHCPFDPNSRLLSNALGGGGILDVGCYPVSLARLVAGAANGKEIEEPINVKGTGHLGSTGVDEYAAALLTFKGDIIAEVSTSTQLNQDSTATIYGTEGSIHITCPWLVAKDGGTWTIEVRKNGESDPQSISENESRSLYTIEADTVADAIHSGKVETKAMGWEDTLGNMRTLDLWRREIGLSYEEEAIDAKRPPINRRAPRPIDGHNMRYSRIQDLDKDISQLVMGCDNQTTMPHAAVMFDDFIEKGGNCFDSAHIYGGYEGGESGICEKFLGQWIEDRGLREDITLISKGGHTPDCHPKGITDQLEESLERLQTDHVDIYFMHRDNLDLPASVFIDVLNKHVQAGKIKIFGGSNWSMERVTAANEYAAQNGLQGFSAVSNNFSLARLVDPVWPGCVSSSDQKSRTWLAEHNLALLPWSSQARGFFTERSGKDKLDDSELVRCWYSEDNFQRKERALELANKKGVTTINIALAYVLAQPFPVFTLIGPRTLSETRTSLPGLDITLTSEEVKYLNLED